MFRKKQFSMILAAMLLAAGSASLPVLAESETEFAGGSGTMEDPWQIEDADQLQAVGSHLDGHFILAADIDLEGAVIEPIGTIVPLGTEGEEAELPTPEFAFTGTFDGDGYTISNYVIEAAEDVSGIGLFGCITGEDATICDLNVENVTVTGGAELVGAVIGFQNAPVSGINLTGENYVTASALVGGLAGGAMADMTDCSAAAHVTMTGENAQGAGILIGGQEGGSVENCTVSGGSVTAEQPGAFSVGAFVGCFQESAYAKNCSVSDVTVTVGENAMMVGALSGHAGCGGENKTEISGCTVENVILNTGKGSERIGGISGGGFYVSAYAEYYPVPCAMAIEDCTVSGLEINGEGTAVGSVLGYSYNNSEVTDCTAEALWNGEALTEQIGANMETLELSVLK